MFYIMERRKQCNDNIIKTLFLRKKTIYFFRYLYILASCDNIEFLLRFLGEVLLSLAIVGPFACLGQKY